MKFDSFSKNIALADFPYYPPLSLSVVSPPQPIPLIRRTHIQANTAVATINPPEDFGEKVASGFQLSFSQKQLFSSFLVSQCRNDCLFHFKG